MSDVFITGGTGYLGTRVIPRLLQRGHRVRALVRPGSEGKLPPGTDAVVGNALDAGTFQDRVAPADTFVQLVGVAHPSPAKAAEFRSVDLASVRASVEAAASAGIQHFIYVSVAQPAPIMRDYVAVRAAGEELIRKSGMHATILRPWYVLGPGHRWPYLLLPAYRLLQLLPSTRETATRLYPVTLRQMVDALVASVDRVPDGVRILATPDIRAARSGA